MVVITDYIVLTLTVWGEHFDHYKILRKLRQVMRVHAMKPYTYNDETIRSITCLIIGDGSKYFRQSLMPSQLTGKIIE